MKSLRLFLLAGFVVGVSMSFMESCGPAKCTCPSGCCDSKGACQAGTATANCGKGGATCSSCSTGQTCSAQVCTTPGTGGGSGGSAGGGTGGGATGGGTGGGTTGGGAGGGAANCINVNMLSSPSTFYVVHLDDTSVSPPAPAVEVVRQFLPTTNLDANGIGTYDYLSTEFYWGQTPPTLPFNFTIVPDTYWNCMQCFLVRTGCKATANPDGGTLPLRTCATSAGAKMYLARSGSATWTSLGDSEDGGHAAGTGSTLHLIEWNYVRVGSGNPTKDEPVVDGGCLDLQGYAFDLTYTNVPNDFWGGVQFDAGQ